MLIAPLVARLERLARSPNEDYRIAVPVALRLGHARIVGVDDHLGETPTGPFTDADGRALQAIWNNDASVTRKAAQARWVADLASGCADVLGWYRWLNSVDAARLAIANDFGAAAADASPRAVGRRYLAYWEARNLVMAANIRAAIGPAPGGRALAIVGASHKPYYERYLGATSDIVFAPVDTVLSPAP